MDDLKIIIYKFKELATEVLDKKANQAHKVMLLSSFLETELKVKREEIEGRDRRINDQEKRLNDLEERLEKNENYSSVGLIGRVERLEEILGE